MQNEYEKQSKNEMKAKSFYYSQEKRTRERNVKIIFAAETENKSENS